MTAKKLRVFCDTNTLLKNLERHHAAEKRALDELWTYAEADDIQFICSKGVPREVENTQNEKKRRQLREDYGRLDHVDKDEKVVGFYSQSDQYGGFISVPLVSDVQDEKIFPKLRTRGLSKMDAELLTQAICNQCDLFLTVDNEIIKHHGTHIQNQFHIKLIKPSVLLKQEKDRRPGGSPDQHPSVGAIHWRS